MTYCAGLLVLALFTFLACKIGRFLDISTNLGNFAFFKLHYLAFGIVLALFFPHNFIISFEKIIGTVLLFCLSWIGLYYGCNLEIRTHQKHSTKAFLFNITEPVIVFIFMVFAGVLYTYIKFNGIKHINIIIIVATFCSLTLFKRHDNPYCEGNYTFNPVLYNLLPVRNIFAITTLCIVGSLFYRTDEFELLGYHFTGTFAFFVFHIIIGLATGIIFSMLIKGAQTSDSMSIILFGGTALTGGIAYTFSLSPLFIGMISGVFLINSTLKRFQTIEALSLSHEHIEKIFMFFLGVLLTPLIKSGTLNLGSILAGTFGILIFRSLLKYFLAVLWVSRLKNEIRSTRNYSRDILLLCVGLTGQGIVAAGAAVESYMFIPNMPSIFFLLIILLILNQTATIIYVLKNQ